MKDVLLNSFKVLILIGIFALIPFVGARLQLKQARTAVLESSAPNYLAHELPSAIDDERRKRLARILDTNVDSVDSVPRIFVSDMPTELVSINHVPKKKQLFTSVVLPLILRANEMILADRALLEQFRARTEAGETLTKSQRQWVHARARQYRLRPGSPLTVQDFDKLLYHVDIIPPSLALSQAAKESGWGGSRFAQEGNALFGEWAWDGSGMVPLGREDGKTHTLKTYEYPLDSVIGYMVNLNRNSNYEDLRKRRAELRKHNLEVTGEALAPGLVKYSEQGLDYVSSVLSMINYNGFSVLDRARLIQS